MELITNVVQAEAADGNICQQCCTRKHCLVNYLEQSYAEELVTAIRHRKPLTRGEHLFIQGDPFYSLYLVRSGSFKSAIIDHTGDRQVTGFYFSGDILGVDGIDSGQHLYEIEALETSSVCSLPFHLVEKICSAGNSGLYRRLVSTVSNMAFRDSQLLMVLGRMHAEQRLASFFLDISDRMNRRGESAQELYLRMARYEIANYLGLAVETVSRLFKRFQSEGLIQASRHRVKILNKDALMQIVSREHRFSGLRNIA